MKTKAKGDIAEQAAILHSLKRGWDVLIPVGDRLPYDLVFLIHRVFVKIQVKSAWFDKKKNNYVVDTRRTQTNRREIKRTPYKQNDFHFALAYIEDIDLFYVFPAAVFMRYKSEIHLVEHLKRQRRPVSATYRDAWSHIAQWAARDENDA